MEEIYSSFRLFLSFNTSDYFEINLSRFGSDRTHGSEQVEVVP
jgi:hypothetical protein